MSAATVVFTDMVGFSKKPTLEQRRLVDALNAEVAHELRACFFPPTRSPDVVALPTGDGMALAFLHRVDRGWSEATLLALIVRLHKWAWAQGTKDRPVGLRMGVHVGAVELVTDINGRTNIGGATINYTQRVMDAANPRQTLFSEAALQEYVGIEKKVLGPATDGGLTYAFAGPFEVFAKHGLKIPVYKLMVEPVDPDSGWYANHDPKPRHLTAVGLAAEHKPLVGGEGDDEAEPFNVRLGRARQVAFIHLTGRRLMDELENGGLKLADNLERLWVFMPAVEVCGRLGAGGGIPGRGGVTEETITGAIKRWTIKLTEWKATRFPEADIKLGIFDRPPYLGGSFLDWERPQGRIHISPYVWGVPATECPGYDFQWLGERPSKAYEVYVKGLAFLNKETANALA